MALKLAPPSRGPRGQRFGAIQLQDGQPHAGDDWLYSANGIEYPEVYAMADGVVLYAGDSKKLGWPNQWYLNPDFDRTDNIDASAGNIVALGHKDGGTTFIADTVYGHLESWCVKAGDFVHRGQLIGIKGNTGFSSGKHLHVALMYRPYYYNTATYGCSDPNPTLPFVLYEGDEELATADILAAIRNIASPGKEGDHNMGPLYWLVQDVQEIKAAIQSGIAGKREAGYLVKMVAGQAGQIETLKAQVQSLASNSGVVFDPSALEAAAERGAARALENITFTAKGK